VVVVLVPGRGGAFVVVVVPVEVVEDVVVPVAVPVGGHALVVLGGVPM
jgi:hypothetical protein